MADLRNLLIEAVEAEASRMYGGHYTILKFTTNYKGFFGTPDGDTLRKALELAPGYPTLNDLLYAMADDPDRHNVYTFEKLAMASREKGVRTLNEIRAQYKDQFGDGF